MCIMLQTKQHLIAHFVEDIDKNVNVRFCRRHENTQRRVPTQDKRCTECDECIRQPPQFNLLIYRLRIRGRVLRQSTRSLIEFFDYSGVFLPRSEWQVLTKKKPYIEYSLLADFRAKHTPNYINSFIFECNYAVAVFLLYNLINSFHFSFHGLSLASLTQLESLELRENLLRTLPASFCQLTRLERLDLGDNEVEVLPALLGRLPALQELWLDHNHLQRLPPDIGQLSQLMCLDVSENK